MKHCKRRFLIQIKIEDTVPKTDEDIGMNLFPIIGGLKSSDLDKHKNDIAILKTEDFLIKSCISKIDGKNYIFPIPDLPLVYFSSAQMVYRNSSELKKKMLNKLDIDINEDKIPPIHEIYEYYFTIFGVVTNLTAALEAFINSMIPLEHIYIEKNSRYEKHYNYEQILRWISMEDKLKKVIPVITNKNFFSKQTPANQRIGDLIKFRGELIHLKPEDDIFYYREVYKKALTFDYEKAIESVAKYLNFYKPNYVVECDCGEDW